MVQLILQAETLLAVQGAVGANGDRPGHTGCRGKLKTAHVASLVVQTWVGLTRPPEVCQAKVWAFPGTAAAFGDIGVRGAAYICVRISQPVSWELFPDSQASPLLGTQPKLLIVAFWALMD